LHLQDLLSETKPSHFDDRSILFATSAISRGLEEKHGDVRWKWTASLCRAEAHGVAGVMRRLPCHEASHLRFALEIVVATGDLSYLFTVLYQRHLHFGTRAGAARPHDWSTAFYHP